MKNNLENKIKESLQDYEMPYDAAAWTSLSAKLDQVMPVSPKSNLKWYLGGAATVAVIVTTIALWPSTPASKSNEMVAVQNETTDINSNGTSNTVGTPTSNKANVPAENNIAPNDNSNSVVANPENGQTQTPIVDGSMINRPNNFWTPPVLIDYNSNDPIVNNNNSKEVVIAAINSVCSGESITIPNNNDVAIIVSDPNGAYTTIKAAKSLKLTPTTEGTYSVGYMDKGEFVSKESFTVKALPKVEITADERNTYDKGLPSIDLKTNSIGTAYTWSFENQSGTVSGKEVSAHYFTKGMYSVSLTVQGSNGCSATESKTITVEDNYNLLAVTGFDPMSTDYRKNSFMPYALTERATDFSLIIINPSNGAIIFETSDATNPWKGLDRQTGQMVDVNKAYIWKVVLANPVKGEKSEYKGTITPTSIK